MKTYWLMDLSSIIPMLILGFSATGHCIGMCAPLVIAFPGKTGKIISHLFYHAGRILTYTIVGSLMGFVGLAVTRFAMIAGFDSLTIITRIQIFFSLSASIFLLLFGLVQLGILFEPGWLYAIHPEKIPGYSYLIRSVSQESNLLLMGLTGMMMGFLPCGLSFAAFSRALATGHPLEGGLLLLAFGTGTLPGLLLIGTGSSFLSRRYRRYIDLLAGILMIWMGITLMFKGISRLA